jgi:hypothetical protein
MEFNGYLHAPASLSSEKISGSHWTGGWVGPRARFDGFEAEKYFGSYSVSCQFDNVQIYLFNIKGSEFCPQTLSMCRYDSYNKQMLFT